MRSAAEALELARRLIDQGEAEDADLVLRMAHGADALQARGVLALLLGHFAVAVDCLGAVAAQQPRALNLRLLAEAQLGAGQPESALVSAVRAAQRTPRDASALVTLGRALAAAGETSAAISALELAISAEDSPQARLELAWVRSARPAEPADPACDRPAGGAID